MEQPSRSLTRRWSRCVRSQLRLTRAIIRAKARVKQRIRRSPLGNRVLQVNLHLVVLALDLGSQSGISACSPPNATLRLIEEADCNAL